MTYIPIIGALALASGTIFQRKILKQREISIKKYFVMEFIAISLVMLPLIYFFWEIKSEAFLLKNVILFSSVIVASILANIFAFKSMKWEKINNIEPAKVLEPLLVILLAILFSFFFEGFDKNPKILVPAILSVFALIFSHIKKRHLDFNKYFIFAIIGSFFFALELILSRLILDYFNPITFYFLRCLILAIFGIAIFHPSFKNVKIKTKFYTLIVGAIWVVFRIITYWGYLKLGVIFTTLIMLLGPVFVYLFAHIFLKEKYNWKNILVSAIIIASVVYATVG